ncbi:hypothetical protein HWV07_08730 [Natronomonas salina]|uniref:hypothetical protein n=1 Tax=Natronomonas salina TaxID=1710540 RepID=UPI0015B6BB81|nr:hypothetical protein [Natronomonas salina]QLD89109.1 hypothetical protein HWV07_08730 [Natronomonas salina]
MSEAEGFNRAITPEFNLLAMSTEGLPDDYYLGLLDSLLRVRFHIRTEPELQFRPQPSVRIGGHGNDQVIALIGELLEKHKIDFELVAPDGGHEYFSIYRHAGFEKLYNFVEGRSANAVRELGFLVGTYRDEIAPRDSLSVDEMYRLARTVNELHYGTTSSGRASLTDPEQFRDKYDVSDVQPETHVIPNTGFRDGYPVEYIGGIIDALATFRPSISRSSYGMGYVMTPQIRLYRGGVHPAFGLSVQQFCEQQNLPCTTTDEMQYLNTIIDGAAAIDEFAPVVGPYLVAKRDELAYLHGELVPRFLNESHHTKQNFYEIVIDFEPLATRGSRRQRNRKYTPEHFEDVWSEDITPVDRTSSSDESAD